MKTKLLILLFWVCYAQNYAQENIQLDNPSFENPPLINETKPRCCIGAKGWFSCGQADLNTPDPQPGNFGINLPPINGGAYLGMVTRDNDTWEAISQRLRTPLVAYQEYFFSVALASSDNLISESRTTQKPVKYDQPVKFRIWGSDGYCQTTELLAESGAITNKEWKYYEFTLKPTKEYTYITFEPFYVTPIIAPNNGNILIDDLSLIIPIKRQNQDLLLKIRDEQKSVLLVFNSNKHLTKVQQGNLARSQNVFNDKVESSITKFSLSEAKENRILNIEKNSKVKTKSPVKWKASLINNSSNKYQMNWHAQIIEGWKIYSEFNSPYNGAMGVKINFESGNHFSLTSKKMESDNFEIIFDEFYNTDMRSFTKGATFSQLLEIKSSTEPIFGNIKYAMSHTDGTIDTQTFEFVILADEGKVIFEKK